MQTPSPQTTVPERWQATLLARYVSKHASDPEDSRSWQRMLQLIRLDARDQPNAGPIVRAWTDYLEVEIPRIDPALTRTRSHTAASRVMVYLREVYEDAAEVEAGLARLQGHEVDPEDERRLRSVKLSISIAPYTSPTPIFPVPFFRPLSEREVKIAVALATQTRKVYNEHGRYFAYRPPWQHALTSINNDGSRIFHAQDKKDFDIWSRNMQTKLHFLAEQLGDRKSGLWMSEILLYVRCSYGGMNERTRLADNTFAVEELIDQMDTWPWQIVLQAILILLKEDELYGPPTTHAEHSLAITSTGSGLLGYRQRRIYGTSAQQPFCTVSSTEECYTTVFLFLHMLLVN
ncbi:hypothetical protein JCM10908_003706 [Rhodotorula pacifica]|uniref:uncharacterized protein n=1 Tax=Rhodotorula pacifica TaxID=1495444 RepID=UPI00317B5607